MPWSLAIWPIGADGLERPSDVGSVDDGNELGVGADGSLNVGRIDEAGVRIDANGCEVDAAFGFQGVKGTEDRVVDPCRK